MTKLKTLLVTALVVMASFGAFAANKYALLVGVNKYKTIRDLSGCVADVQNMTEMLVRYGGWSAGSVWQLLDEKVTVANVQSAFKTLVSHVKSGDTVVIYWSAHGGYTAYDPKTKTESAYVCTHDGEYTDKMLANDLGRFPSGAQVVVVIDTCQSGGLFQTVTVGENAKAAAPTIAQNVDALLARSKTGGISANEIGWLTAVAYDQYSLDEGDIGGRYTTLCLYHDGVIWGKADTDEDGNISFLDLHNHARRWFSKEAVTERMLKIYGSTQSKTAEKEIDGVSTRSPQMLHEDVLASVLARDRAVAGEGAYPFKVQFALVCDYQDAAQPDVDVASFTSNGLMRSVQFVWPGESAVEPAFEYGKKYDKKDSRFDGWDADFTNVRTNLIVHGQFVCLEADVETFETVAGTIKKFIGYTLVEGSYPPDNDFLRIGAKLEGSYAKSGRITVTLTDVDGAKRKFAGELDSTPSNGLFVAELTTSRSDDTIQLQMTDASISETSPISGTYVCNGVKYPISGNWDWLSTTDTTAQAVRKRFAAVYNVAMSNRFCEGRADLSKVGGYVSVTVSDRDSKVKVAGMLADGTKISVATKAVVLTNPSTTLAKNEDIYVPIVCAGTKKRTGFSGLLYLSVSGDKRVAFSPKNANNQYFLSYWNSPAQGDVPSCRAFLYGEGSEFLADKMPETAGTIMPYPGDVPPLYVKVNGQTVALTCENDALPNGYGLTYDKGRFKVVYPESDRSKLKLTMNTRTGVISGSFRVWYADDPADPEVERYVTANVYGAWDSSAEGASAFGLVTDTNPDRAKLKLKVPLALEIGVPEDSED